MVRKLLPRTEISYLGAVDELSQGDISVVAENVNILKGAGGAVLELDAEEVTEVRRGSAAELNGESRGVVG